MSEIGKELEESQETFQEATPRLTETLENIEAAQDLVATDMPPEGSSLAEAGCYLDQAQAILEGLARVVPEYSTLLSEFDQQGRRSDTTPVTHEPSAPVAPREKLSPQAQWQAFRNSRAHIIDLMTSEGLNLSPGYVSVDEVILLQKAVALLETQDVFYKEQILDLEGFSPREVFAALEKLEKRTLLVGRMNEPTPDTQLPQRVYQLTELGKQIEAFSVDQAVAELAQTKAALTDLLETEIGRPRQRPIRSDDVDVMRAIAELTTSNPVFYRAQVAKIVGYYESVDAALKRLFADRMLETQKEQGDIHRLGRSLRRLYRPTSLGEKVFTLLR